MNAEQIYARLIVIAPLVAFSAGKELDPYLSWNGDGPSPREDGYSPYTVEIRATTIHAGEMKSASEFLGGCWMKEEEPIDDVHGYLPQMLEEAADDLLARLCGDHPAVPQLNAAREFLKREMRSRYNKQRTSNA